jgi:hypothetical protein
MHGATAANFFALAAASMVLLGVLSASSVMLTRWGPKGGAVPEIRPMFSGKTINAAGDAGGRR